MTGKRKVDDFVMTIEDEDEVEDMGDEMIVEPVKKPKKVIPKEEETKEDDMEEFNFDDGKEVVLPWDFQPTIEQMKKNKPAPKSQTTLDAKIQKILNLKKLENTDNNNNINKDDKKEEEDIDININGEDEEDDSDNEDIEEEEVEEPKQSVKQQQQKKNNEKDEEESDDESESEDEEEEEETTGKNRKEDVLKVLESRKRMKKVQEEELPTFEELHLSRPLQKAVTKLGYIKPTPIQAKSIPLILNGKDLLASATTGSGKTAAFILPILERLLYRDAVHRVSRVLVVLPTRELALQCQSVLQSLAQFSNITSCLVVGGLSNKAQEHELRKRPDVIIATPGRLIDHLLNAHDIGLEDIEILVLDEADRLLDMGFKDELNRIVESCPPGRQTLLFSATLSDDVKLLAKLSLNQPIRVAVDALFQVASTLEQEFIKVKPGQLPDRTAMLMSLCTRTFNGGGCIIFFRSKKEVHRIAIFCGLAGLKVAELHGDLNQEQRFEALQSFRNGEVDFLLATDIAARGLDVLGVRTVINYNMPRNLANYIHRVGRTARAGELGRSCSFVTEADRKILKDIVSRAKTKAKSRSIAPESITHWRQRIEEMTPDVKDVIRLELKEQELTKVEKELSRAERIVNNPNKSSIGTGDLERVWFQTHKERTQAREDWKAENGIVKIGVDGKPLSDKPKKGGVLLKKAPKDPYAGMSRKKRRSVMHREDMAREMAEEDREDNGYKEVTKDDVANKFRQTQNSQRAAGKETKRLEQLRRAGIYAGPTPQEKLKLDAKQAKKDSKLKKKKVQRDDYEKDIVNISSGKSNFKKGKVLSKSKSKGGK